MASYSDRKNWELEHTGGGNYSFIRNFISKEGKKVMVFVNDLGASIPLHENKIPKTKKEYQEDFTYEFIDLINWVDEEKGYEIQNDAYKFLNESQIKEALKTCKQLDKFYNNDCY
jgi:hypothetical protein